MKGVQDKWLDVNIPSEGYRSRVERHTQNILKATPSALRVISQPRTPVSD